MVSLTTGCTAIARGRRESYPGAIWALDEQPRIVDARTAASAPGRRSARDLSDGLARVDLVEDVKDLLFGEIPELYEYLTQELVGLVGGLGLRLESQRFVELLRVDEAFLEGHLAEKFPPGAHRSSLLSLPGEASQKAFPLRGMESPSENVASIRTPGQPDGHGSPGLEPPDEVSRGCARRRAGRRARLPLSALL